MIEKIGIMKTKITSVKLYTLYNIIYLRIKRVLDFIYELL